MDGHCTYSTLCRRMRTRSGRAVETAPPVIPADMGTPCVFTADEAKIGANMDRLRIYGTEGTYGAALLAGMLPQDWRFDVLHGLCTVRGVRLPKGVMRKCKDKGNECFVCRESFDKLIRGRVYVCRHQVCYDCDNVPHALRVQRCACGREAVHL